MAKRNQKTGRVEAQLDQRLNEYTTAARVSAAFGSLHTRTGNWPIYAAAVGSALAMGTNASASMIYCGPGNNYCDPSGPHHSAPQADATAPGHKFIQAVGLDGAGHFFNLEASAAPNFGLLSGQAPGHVHVFVTYGAVSGTFVKKFASGAMISTGPAKNSAQIVRFASAGTVFGDFSANHSAFAGLSITGVGLGGLQTEYGWIRLDVINGTNGFPQILEAIDWAIESPGVAIETPTPEPGTMALALLAAGAAGVMALRRRKTQA